MYAQAAEPRKKSLFGANALGAKDEEEEKPAAKSNALFDDDEDDAPARPVQQPAS